MVLSLAQWNRGISPTGEFSATQIPSESSARLQRLLLAAYPERQAELTFSENDLIQSLAQLSPHALARLQETLGNHLARWIQLSQEQEPELFFSGVLSLAQDLEVSETGRALGIYAAALQELQELEAPWARRLTGRAHTRMEVLQGSASMMDRLPFLFGRLAHEAFNPVMIGSFIAGGVANHVLRQVGRGFFAQQQSIGLLRTGLPREFAAGLFAFLGEVPAFVLATRGLDRMINGTDSPLQQTPWADEFTSTAMFLGVLKATGFLTGQILRNSPPHALLHRGMQGAGTLAGIYGGQRLQERYGFLPGRDEANRWVDAVDTMIHLQIGGKIAHGLAPLPQARFEGSARRHFSTATEPRGPEGLFPNLLPQVVGVAGRSSPLPSQGNRISEPLSTNQVYSISQSMGKTALSEQFRNRLTSRHGSSQVQAILNRVRAMPSDIPGFHERFLSALTHLPGRGGVAMARFVEVVSDIMAQDPLRTATGSFENARLQLLVEEAMKQNDPQRRLNALGDLYSAMQRGIRPEKVGQLLDRYGFGQNLKTPTYPIFPGPFWNRYRRLARHDLAGYREDDVVLILNYIYQAARGNADRSIAMMRAFGKGRNSGAYRNRDIDTVLDRARNHPQNSLILRRLMNLFSVGDSPAKLSELIRSERDWVGFVHLNRLRREGMSAEQIAQGINGTRHTGYLQDMRLARKVTTVLLEAAPYVWEGNEHRVAQIRRAKGQFFERFQEGRELEGRDLIEALRRVGARGSLAARIQQLIAAYESGRYLIEILPGEQFDRRIAEWGGVAGCSLSFIDPTGHPRHSPRIMIREIPELTGRSLQNISASEFENLFNQFYRRVKLLVHEGEHWRHFSGEYVGWEVGGKPLRTGRRQDRLVSEMMAMYEEFSWAIQNYGDFHWAYAQMAGQDLATVFRDISDMAYFGPQNDKIARQYFPADQ